MNEYTYERYESLAVWYAALNPQALRKRQAYYNQLWVVRPDLAERVSGTEFDPFYDDRLTGKFLEWCKKEWNK